MCSFRELFCDDNGYVIRCNECRHYQILFNRTVLSVNEKEFKKLSENLTFEYSKEQQPLKDILLPTPRQGVYMLLSPFQLLQFQQMIEAADAEQNALAMMQLFHSPTL